MVGNYGVRSYRNGMLDEPRARMSDALRDHLMVLPRSQRHAHILEWNKIREFYPHFGPEQIDRVVTELFTKPQPNQSAADTFEAMKEFVDFDLSPVSRTAAKKDSRTNQSTSTTNMETPRSRPRANAILPTKTRLKELPLEMIGPGDDAMEIGGPFSQKELEKENDI